MRMTRYAIDAPTALRIVRERIEVPGAHSLVGPSVLRSHALSALYRAVRAGEVDSAEGKGLLERIAELKIRLLGDRVSRATAWRIAAERDWPDIGAAEYLAVAVLQADALITQDAALTAAAEGLVPVVELSAVTSTGAAGDSP